MQKYTLLIVNSCLHFPIIGESECKRQRQLDRKPIFTSWQVKQNIRTEYLSAILSLIFARKPIFMRWEANFCL